MLTMDFFQSTHAHSARTDNNPLSELACDFQEHDCNIDQLLQVFGQYQGWFWLNTSALYYEDPVPVLCYGATDCLYNTAHLIRHRRARERMWYHTHRVPPKSQRNPKWKDFCQNARLSIVVQERQKYHNSIFIFLSPLITCRCCCYWKVWSYPQCPHQSSSITSLLFVKGH